MSEAEIEHLIRRALEAAAADLGLEGALPDRIEVVHPRQKEHGDYATNVALVLAPRLGRAPREIAEAIAARVPSSEAVAKVEVAGPGFINITMSEGWLHRVLVEADRLGERFGHVDVAGGERVQVEFVSANPTGPLHVGTGRNAAVGDSLARLLEAAGYQVEREYYVNDAGTQAELFAASIEARYLERFGRDAEVPEGGYHGRYVADLAEEIGKDLGDALLDAPREERLERLREEGIRRTLDGIERTLARFAVRIDTWFRESSMHLSGRIRETVRALRDAGVAYEDEGATWFRASRFGDEKDRVLIRSTGEPTYFAADCAYVREKFDRGFERLVYVWGADHHGTVKRLRGAAEALGYDPSRVEVILIQLVALHREGEPVRMSKRTGEIVTLDELLDEVGTDAARYTLLTRSTDTALDFDIGLAASESMENPVYYVQYAHARISGILRFAAERGIEAPPAGDLALEVLTEGSELDLLRAIAELPEQIATAATMRAPARLTRYAEELAAQFHRFYTECRVVTEDAELTRARLALARGTRTALANVLRILGVGAPESMERLGDG